MGVSSTCIIPKSVCLRVISASVFGDESHVLFQLEQKQIPPPHRPKLTHEADLGNFPPEFTDEPVQLTPDDP